MGVPRERASCQRPGACAAVENLWKLGPVRVSTGSPHVGAPFIRAADPRLYCLGRCGRPHDSWIRERTANGSEAEPSPDDPHGNGAGRAVVVPVVIANSWTALHDWLSTTRAGRQAAKGRRADREESAPSELVAEVASQDLDDSRGDLGAARTSRSSALRTAGVEPIQLRGLPWRWNRGTDRPLQVRHVPRGGRGPTEGRMSGRVRPSPEMRFHHRRRQ
jgi:hypothetical protein